jgi:hypothetical protein
MMRVVCLAVVVWLGACAGSPPAVPTVQLDPVRVPPPGSAQLAAVSFMVGCWRSPGGEGRTSVEERWSPGEGGVMLGTTRYMRGGQVVSFEFALLRAEGDDLTFLPHPGGVASEHLFRLTRAAPGEAVFEAPEHDYPRRIIYRSLPEGLQATIDAGDGDDSPRSWTMNGIDCG